MKNAINKLFELRQSLDVYEKKLGLDKYSEVERAVFSYISSSTKTTITAIKNEPYFSKYSLSTIKRAVLFLSSSGIVKAEQSEADKREMLLFIDA